MRARTSYPATAIALLALAMLSPSARTQGATPPATRPVADRIPRTTVQLDMVRVPGGRITLKDKDGRETTHEIKPFLIQRTESRWDEWDVFHLGLDVMQEEGRQRRDALLKPSPNSYFPPDRGFGHEGCPIHGITLHAVRQYIGWLCQATGKRYRLPTEAEWEWACRAGGPPFRPDPKDLDKVAWFWLNSDAPKPVARKKPNAWGLYDMLGNVGEWVVRPDGTAVLAGGSYQDRAKDVHSGGREVPDLNQWQRDDPQIPRSPIWLSNGTHVGFRLVREIEAGEDK
jgi:formylglycine-generating enzyme required for sulfatase activity